MKNAIDILKEHVASISDQDETDMDLILQQPRYVLEYADLALRTCHCGQRLADVYSYHDHLVAMLEKEIE